MRIQCARQSSQVHSLRGAAPVSDYSHHTSVQFRESHKAVAAMLKLPEYEAFKRAAEAEGIKPSPLARKLMLEFLAKRNALPQVEESP